MILGDICTRNCRFCATMTGRPLPPDEAEPEKVAESVKLMGLKHAVITSVTRDDLPDHGAAIWARTVEAVRRENPESTIELLISDMDARPELINQVLASRPDIVGHNIETVERLTPEVRSRAKYRTSLETLRLIAESGAVAKSGLMVGLGESEEEILQTLRDLREVGVSIVTLGQYLRPTKEHYPVKAYITPEKFEEYRLKALEMGFAYCASAPLVRSSYLADAALEAVRKVCNTK
jgi:lipoic acid synthetase